MPRSLVIANPNASRLRDAGTCERVLSHLRGTLRARDGAEPAVVVTGSADDTGPAVRDGLADGAASVIGIGGDGTLRDIAAALAGSGVPLGVVPAGTGNQLASVLGIPRSFDAAVGALATARPRTIDLGEVTLERHDGEIATMAFTIGCGMGFDARVMATTPAAWKRKAGSAAYFVQATRLALRISALPYRITLDDEVIETDASVALVGNMGGLVPGRIGPRLPIVPDDGLLDLLVVGARGPLHGLRGLADQLLRTSLGGGSGSDSLRLRGRSIAIEAARPEPLEVDGDYVGTGSLRARVRPAAIDVLVPGAKT
jgi:diacylglycerol kinase family enzyme